MATTPHPAEGMNTARAEWPERTPNGSLSGSLSTECSTDASPTAFVYSLSFPRSGRSAVVAASLV